MVEFKNTELPDIVELRGVSQSYDGGQNYVLRDLNLLIEDKPGQGEFVVVLGISGSGKSTLLRYVAGLQKPTSGQVFIDGAPLNGQAISMVFQQYSSFPWYSVLQNVELPLKLKGVPKKERRERAMEMIQRVGLLGHERKYAQYPILSGGQLQRVAIARSLIANPRIVLMDEPFGALDGLTRYEMQVMLAELWESLQSTIIFVTHDLAEAVFLGDDIYVLDPRVGKISSHIQVGLPKHRDYSTKRSHAFLEYIAEVEAALVETGRPLSAG